MLYLGGYTIPNFVPNSDLAMKYLTMRRILSLIVSPYSVNLIGKPAAIVKLPVLDDMIQKRDKLLDYWLLEYSYGWYEIINLSHIEITRMDYLFQLISSLPGDEEKNSGSKTRNQRASDSPLSGLHAEPLAPSSAGVFFGPIGSEKHSFAGTTCFFGLTDRKWLYNLRKLICPMKSDLFYC